MVPLGVCPLPVLVLLYEAGHTLTATFLWINDAAGFDSDYTTVSSEPPPPLYQYHCTNISISIGNVTSILFDYSPISPIVPRLC